MPIEDGFRLSRTGSSAGAHLDPAGCVSPGHRAGLPEFHAIRIRDESWTPLFLVSAQRRARMGEGLRGEIGELRVRLQVRRQTLAFAVLRVRNRSSGRFLHSNSIWTLLSVWLEAHDWEWEARLH
jgi:hypothetical protein